jgi:hypothetical protein
LGTLERTFGHPQRLWAVIQQDGNIVDDRVSMPGGAMQMLARLGQREPVARANQAAE